MLLAYVVATTILMWYAKIVANIKLLMAHMPNVSLLPCPFCGGVPTLAELEHEYRFVMCNTCGACISNMDSMPENDCAEIWNTRANM